LFAVVDVWDALRSERPYRKAWPAEKVRKHLMEQSGKHFDPQALSMFLKMLDQEESAGLPADMKN
jgi:HD-GYP domain-containing protein (c-di-GMP phosphodiesterase class II)